jgi:hypothetical protein
MATDTATRGTALLRAALLMTTGLVLFVNSPASARVGVTSGADGDPLGKPPNENERILRIGIDVQADEVITTAANDRAHLVFLDGSSLTVGPDARLTIDRFVFDPATQKGDLAINATKGVFRLVGGKISKSNAIVIKTPASTIGIRGGITIFSVNQNQTTADFIFGYSMTVTAGGLTQTANRAGSQIVTNAGGVPGAPTLLKPGSLTAALGNLEGAKSNGNNGADQSAEKSGFSNKNSGQPANAPTFNQNLPPNTNNNTLTNAVSFSNPAGQPVGNSALQNQPKINPVSTTVTITNTVAPIIPNTTPTTPIPPPNNNPPPSGPTTKTQSGFTAGLAVVIDRPGSEGDRHSRHVSVLTQSGTVNITTNSANNQASGTLNVKVNDSHNSAATLQLSGTTNGTSVVMRNDPSRQSTLQIDGHTYNISPHTLLAGASSPSICTCEFLSWGVWASSARDPLNNGKTLAAFGSYVAGTPTTTVQLPTTGTATYNGSMVGFASNNGHISPASGTYQNVWSFQNGNGVFNGSFDGRSYSGTTTGRAGTTAFTGTFNSTSGYNRSGNLNGGFFSSPSDAAAYQAGTFSIGGARSRYQATGIFAGQR